MGGRAVTVEEALAEWPGFAETYHLRDGFCQRPGCHEPAIMPTHSVRPGGRCAGLVYGVPSLFCSQACAQSGLDRGSVERRGLKRCCTCRQWLDSSMFSLSGGAADGFQRLCRDCGAVRAGTQRRMYPFGCGKVAHKLGWSRERCFVQLDEQDWRSPVTGDDLRPHYERWLVEQDKPVGERGYSPVCLHHNHETMQGIAFIEHRFNRCAGAVGDDADDVQLVADWLRSAHNPQLRLVV